MEIPPPYIQPEPERRKQSLISVDMLLAAFDGAWRRFPVTMIFIVYSTLWGMLYIACFDELLSDKHNLIGALFYLAGVGVPLTLAVSLWCEFLNRSVKVPMALGLLLLAADFVYILTCGSELGQYWTLSRVSIVSALVVAILFVPSRQLWAWNFSNAQMGAILVGAAFSWGFSIAIGLIFLTIFALFNVEETKVMFCVQMVCSFAVPAVIFLHLIPRRKDAEALSHSFKASKFQCGTAKYFFLLITAVYMAILYVYGLKILATWELPRGVVTWSVTGLTVAVLITLFLLEGVRRTHPDDKFTLNAVKWLPIAMLPLLVLMSVGLFYRIGQYGLTASRLYVLTFNVWCYAVFIYMILSRTRVFSVVAVSFAAVFLTTSVLPYFNYTTLAQNMMRRNLREALVNMGFSEFPVGEKEFVAAYKKLPQQQKRDIESKIKYLDEEKNHSLLSDITGAVYYSDVEGDYISSYFFCVDCDTVETVEPSTWHSFAFEIESDFTEIPEGYNAVRWITRQWNYKKFSTNPEEITVDKITYQIPVDSVLNLEDKGDFTGLKLYPVSGNSDSLLLLREVRVGYHSDKWADERRLDRISVEGFIFIKQKNNNQP